MTQAELKAKIAEIRQLIIDETAAVRSDNDAKFAALMLMALDIGGDALCDLKRIADSLQRIAAKN